MATQAAVVIAPKLVKLDLIDPSPVQKRSVFEKQDLVELAASIERQGLLSPPIVRPHPKKKGRFELVAGERRVRAARLIPWKTIPVVVRTLTDDEAHEITAVENLAREDLTPLEEAESINVLLNAKGATTESVADRLGRPTSWVAKRAKLTALSSKWVKAMGEDSEVGETLRLWPVSLLEMVARLPRKEDQDGLLLFFGVKNQVPTTAELREHIDSQILMKLSSAPWSLSDAELDKKAGACDVCQSRTSCQPDLFSDLETEGKRQGYCLDSSCWQRKVASFRDKRFEQLAAEHPTLKTIDNDDRWQHRFESKGKGPERPYPGDMAKRLVDNYKWQECKKDAKDAQPVFVVNGPGTGGLSWMRPVSSRADELAKPKGPKPLEERRELLQKRRNKAFDERVMVYLDELDKGKQALPESVTTDRILAAVRAFGCEPIEGNFFSYWSHYHAETDTDIVGLARNLAWNLVPVWRRRVSGDPSYNCDGVFAHEVAAFFGIDAATMEAEIAADLPEPKCWADQASEEEAEETPDKHPPKGGKKERTTWTNDEPIEPPELEAAPGGDDAGDPVGEEELEDVATVQREA